MKKNYLDLYIDFLSRHLEIKKPIRVVFDSSNGTAGLVIKNLESRIQNLESILINGRPDGNFPAHGPDPWAPGAMDQLCKEAVKQKADLGAIFDADGDRTFFVDNRGRPVDPDIIAWLLVWHFKPKQFVADLRTGWLIKRSNVKGQMPKVIESRVGHYFIKQLMRRYQCELGVERSGHYYYKKFFYLDSGVFTAVNVINAVSELPYSLADLADFLPAYYRSGEINFRLKTTEGLINFIERKYKSATSKIYYLDGLTMEFKDWWFNLRFSNTEPLARLNIETLNPDLLKEKIKELTELIVEFDRT